MKKTLYVLSLGCTLLLAACQDEAEDSVKPTVPTEDKAEGTSAGDEPVATSIEAPTLETIGLPQSNVIALAIIVEGTQTDGTVHYAAFPEKVHAGKPTVQELMDSPYRDEHAMDGKTRYEFTYTASSETKYFVYAAVQVGDQISEVAELQVETI